MFSVEQLLEREILLISRFIEILADEQTALKAAQPELLPSLQIEKTRLTNDLNALESERIQVIGPLAGQSNRELMIAWINKQPNPEKIAALWKQLIQLAGEAKRHNELNAALVKLHLEKTTQALNILTRHSQEHILYGSNGQTSSRTGSRLVDSA